jgi:hypothetical protein
VGPRADLDRCGKSRPHWDSNPDRPVAIPTELPGPLWSCYTDTNMIMFLECVKFLFSLHVPNDYVASDMDVSDIVCRNLICNQKKIYEIEK